MNASTSPHSGGVGLARGEPLPADQAPFLKALFGLLARTGLDYCVLRNFETLPDRVPGTDIDIVVARGQERRFGEAVGRAAESVGWTLVRETEKDFRVDSYLVADLRQGCAPAFVVIDAMSVIGWRGLSVIPAATILRHATDYRGIRGASPGAQAAILLLNSTLYVGRLKKDEYRRQVSEAAAAPSEAFRSILEESIGPRAAERLCSVVAQRGVESLPGEQRRLRNAVARRAWRHPLLAITDRFHRLRLVLARLASPPGAFLAIIGTDGSGKSTIAKGVCDLLEPIFGTVHLGHLRPRVFPDLRRLAGRPPAPVGDIASVRRRPGALGSLIRWGYYWLDYLLGYQIRFRPVLARKGLVVCDRYFYDFEFDHGAKNVRLPGWFLRFGQRFLPRPDAVVHVRTAPEVAMRRRVGETYLDEIARQQGAIDRIISRLDRGAAVGNDGSVEDATDAAIRHLMRMMARRRR